MNEAFKKQQFKKGQSGNPKGRVPPKGSAELRKELEKWMYENRVMFVKRLGKYAMTHPVAFMRDVYIPMMPKDSLLEITGEDGKTAIWHCLTEMGVSETNAAAMLQAAGTKPAIDVDSKEVPDAGNP
jgi:hypothetical protein